MHQGITLARSIFYQFFFFLAFVTFGLASGLTGKSISDYNVYSPPVIALLSIALLSLLVIIPLHLIFHRRPSASGIASVWVELLILSIFCVGYIGSAGATAANLGIGYYCHLFAVDYYTDYFYNVDDGECAIMDGLDAIAWLTAVLLLALIILVVVSSVQQQNRGNEDVWTTQFGYATTQTSPKVTQVIPVPEVYQPGGPQVYHPVPLKSSPPSKEGQVPYPHGHGVYPHAIAGTDNYGPNNV